LKNQDTSTLLEYTEDNALLLVENSSEFDNWLNEVVFDLENFRTDFKSKTKGQTGPVTEA
jgi:hypothetical protein